MIPENFKKANYLAFTGKATIWTIMLMSQRTSAAIRAGPKPVTLKPGTMLAASIISAAFITKVKSPNVRILIGKVKTTKTGLMMALMMPRTRATTRAVVKELTLKPGK